MTETPKENTKLPKARILIVDDDHLTLDSLGNFLIAEGYDTMAVASATKAIDCLEGGRFNLVITDVNMPDREGFELLRHIRVKHADTVVIMITAYGTIESAVEAIKQGACDYLTKPLIDDDVRLTVQRALLHQHLQEENFRLRHMLAAMESCDLPPALAGTVREPVAPDNSGLTITAPADPAGKPQKTLDETVAGIERQIILQTLRANNGSRQLAATQLGINRCTLYKKMKRYGLLDEI